jgi:gluconolactonase
MLQSALLLLSFISSAAEDKIPAPTGAPIVASDAKLEKLFTRKAPIKDGLTEGPAAAPDGSIYFSDIPFGKDKGMILRYDPKTNKTTLFVADSFKSNGLKFDRKGNLLACEGSDEGGRCVSRWDVKTKKRTVIVDRYHGKKFNAPNDLVLDRKGRIYFSDPRYLGNEKRELKFRSVYRVDPDGKNLVRITNKAEKPNGVALSPDDKTLYVIDHNNGTDKIDPAAPPPKKGAMKVYAFPLDADGKVQGERRTLLDFKDENGCDGMTVDTKGNVYLASRSLKRPGILVINPEGKEQAFIPTGPSQPGAKNPKGIPSNVTFGRGDASNILYVTIDTSLYRIKLKSKGYHSIDAKK